MSRAVPEWVATHDDQAVPQRVKLRIWRRDANEDGFAICRISGLPIKHGDDFQLDHITPLILGGRHAEQNLAFVLTHLHRQKTATEVAVRADTDAKAISHHGLGAVVETGLQGRTKEQKRAAKDRKTSEAGKLAMPPRRPLYGPADPAPTTQILALDAPKRKSAA